MKIKHHQSPRSPWLHQLKRTRPVQSLDRTHKVNVAIVGGGIAGIVSAYFILRHTKYSVLVVEGDKVAHGATGHNAGQVTSYFERPFGSLVEEFGLELASKGQGAIESAWDLLEEIRKDAQLKVPVWRFTGYAGCTNLDQVLLDLKDNALRAAGGLLVERIYISGEDVKEDQIPLEYRHLCQFVPREYIRSLLETKDESFIAAICYDKGCMNSAVFTEELVEYLVTHHSDRFSIHEMTPISKVELQADGAMLYTAKEHAIHAKHVLLCTNGFKTITIKNNAGPDIDTEFHHTVRGKVSYMAGFLEPMDRPPTAISYYTEKGANPEDPYFYLTRRPFDLSNQATPENIVKNLLCVGGLDEWWEEIHKYNREHPFKKRELQKFENFLKDTYQYYTEYREEELFVWHGLMGYTTNRVRLVGPEPCNPVLMYNLGCNGVGLLPSIYGGRRIADILAGKEVEKSIFDPRDMREMHKAKLTVDPSLEVRDT